MVHDLSRQMKISLKKQRLGNSVKHQIHKIIRITSNNGKIEYRGSTYAKNEVVLEPGWLSDAFELRESQFYKLVKTLTRDDDSPNIVQQVRYKYLDCHHHVLKFSLACRIVIHATQKHH